jgi:putative DNA methylase
MEGSVFYRRRLPHWQPDGATIFVTYRLADSLPVEIQAELRESRARLSREPLRAEETDQDRAIRIGKRVFAQLDNALTTATSPKWLGERRIAMLVRDSLKYWDGTHYRLHRYVIMPNHVHILIEPLPVTQTPIGPQTPIVGQTVSLPENGMVIEDSNEWQTNSLPHGSSLQDRGRNMDAFEIACWPLRRIMQSLKGYTAREANRLLGRHGSFWQDENFDHWARDEAEFVRIAQYIDGNPVNAGLCSYAHEWEWSSAFDEYVAENARA